MASAGAVLAIATGIGLGVAAERKGHATPAGDIGRAAGADISGGAVGKELGELAQTQAPEIPTEQVQQEFEDMRKKRRGAIGTRQRRSPFSSLLTSGVSNTLGE